MATATLISKPVTSILLEDRTFSESLKVDRENRVIRGVKILGRTSRNGYEYSDRALREAAALYEGVTVNVNHPPREKPNQERGFNEGIGVLRGVFADSDGVRGDLHYFEAHADTPLMLERAEKHPNTFGLSHNADGQKSTVRGRTIVESVTKVRSVDLVGKPATTNGIFESEQLPVKKTINQLLESVSRKIKGHARLLEMVEADPAMGDVPVEMPIDAATEAPTEKPEDQIKAGILAAILSKLESASEDELAAVMAALGLGDSLSAAAAGKAGSADAGGDAAGEATTESLKEGAMKELAALRESVNELTRERDAARKENAARQLLESLDREATPLRVKALTLLESEQERKQLVESWPRRQAASGQPPRRSVPLTESEQGEYKPAASAKEWAAAVR